MRLLLTMIAGALLTACGGNVATVEPVRYDFGSLSGGGSGSRLPVVAVEVQAVPALNGPAIHYRLAYAEILITSGNEKKYLGFLVEWDC